MNQSKSLRLVCDERVYKMANKLAQNQGTSVSEYIRNLIEIESAMMDQETTHEDDSSYADA